MKKLIYRNQEIEKIILDESFIQGFKWIDDNNENPTNLEIEIDLNGQQDLLDYFDLMNIKTNFVFNLVIDAQFNFVFKPPYTIGALEITSFTYQYNEISQLYLIEFKFDFSPVGYIKFNCTDFYFEIIE